MQPKKPNGNGPQKPVNKTGVKVIKEEPIKPKTGFTEFPSAKLASIKTADPFA